MQIHMGYQKQIAAVSVAGRLMQCYVRTVTVEVGLKRCLMGTQPGSSITSLHAAVAGTHASELRYAWQPNFAWHLVN